MSCDWLLVISTPTSGTPFWIVIHCSYSTGIYPTLQYTFLSCDSLQLYPLVCIQHCSIPLWFMIPFSYIHWHVSSSLVSPSELRFLAVISTGMYPPLQYPFLRCDSLQLLYIHWNVSTTAVSLSELWFHADISTGMYSPVKYPLLGYESLQLYICHISTISEKHVQNTRSSC
jgi:hypothetical protein